MIKICFFSLYPITFQFFCAFPLSSISDAPNQHDAGPCVDLTACPVSPHAVSAYMLLPTSLFCVGALSCTRLYKEMFVWTAHGCRSDSYPSPWSSSLLINIITARWEHTHSPRAHTTTHTHELLIQIGANRLAVIINKHGGLILCTLSLLFYRASQGNYQVVDC